MCWASINCTVTLLLKRVCRSSCLRYGNEPEYEANIVAAEILLDTDELLEYIYQYGYTSEQIARAMNTDINLVALKIAHLAETGYDLRRIEHRSDFLK
jgi:Zn-dependent peptidase ImmA (M78 family)